MLRVAMDTTTAATPVVGRDPRPDSLLQCLPRHTPAELQEARIRSGRLGGRPCKPTVEEARRAALDELVPKALKVLNEHLDSGRAGPSYQRCRTGQPRY
jgi:hypothetical protein